MYPRSVERPRRCVTLALTCLAIVAVTLSLAPAADAASFTKTFSRTDTTPKSCYPLRLTKSTTVTVTLRFTSVPPSVTTAALVASPTWYSVSSWSPEVPKLYLNQPRTSASRSLRMTLNSNGRPPGAKPGVEVDGSGISDSQGRAKRLTGSVTISSPDLKAVNGAVKC